MKNDNLIARLCEASEGSKELSRQFWVAMGAVMPATSPCLTTSLSAAWEEAKARCKTFSVDTDGESVAVFLEWDASGALVDMYGKHEACTIVAALLAAEGER